MYVECTDKRVNSKRLQLFDGQNVRLEAVDTLVSRYLCQESVALFVSFVNWDDESWATAILVLMIENPCEPAFLR